MATMEKKWEVIPAMPEAARERLVRWQDEPLLQQLFWNRELRSEPQVLAFVRREMSRETDPFQLAGMDVAVERVLAALDEGERVAVYGDYDVDGVTATLLLLELLQAFNGDVVPYIPRRHDEGYGLHNAAFEALAAQGVRLVITVDCGVRALEQAEHARGLGLDLIISDHHHVGDMLPPAVAVINPKRADCFYPEQMLSGVGIAYKMAAALLARRTPAQAGILAHDFLDLVALGTVADLAPLCGENRALVHAGLERLNAAPRPGIRALLQAARSNGRVTARTIGFQLGPRLNAAGRLGSAMDALRLLGTRDDEEATCLARELEKRNRKRQSLTREMSERALDIALEQAEEVDPLILFAAHEDFHSGLVGLVAARLCEQRNRPAVVAQRKNGLITGSARSVAEFHIADALRQCADLLHRHGGHAAAAGFTLRLPEENWKLFVRQLGEIAREQLSEKDLRPMLSIDAQVRPAQLTERLAEQLNYFEPAGTENLTPLFLWRGAQVVERRAVGKSNAHLKLKVHAENGEPLDAIGFWLGDRLEQLPEMVDLVFAFETNEWLGRKRQQLNLKDVRAAA
jgi:single-stranded-DNA-specific exonuclease